MKTKKKTTPNIDDLEAVISSGKAKIEEPTKRRPQGRPKGKVKKAQCPFYLPENIVKAIDKNCRGNKSVFAEEVFRFYFDSKEIEY
ncbi:MAG: hypothetical protein Q8K92_13690 [Leadbetterella sp.]|nr:hypothetical protein [Leadbetterella sp.]